MAFQVRYTEKGMSTNYDTQDSYDFLEGGVLAITFGDESKWSEYVAPGNWFQVTASNDHPPGGPGGPSEAFVM